ncbi:Tat pathway signal protein [Candidatus Nitrosocosmicus sp. SS]|jgi:hypothetical protein|uniref:Tat pathway signal protein n=1 Tax=Candidatus Nitrosocosmicus agrestis TaxID=2563600 RepID=UPI00122E2E35|nr:Tat pathway signal protein [Candidatus Nitrosocosmicus sp. SS]KAA2283558.1 Tat pathway signal protein [Candidatus Nitrosocosmicus sp. SS]KAF0869639.1 Tat pathway signal protein [Candidatus Nitrosocosmicus sp. SS]
MIAKLPRQVIEEMAQRSQRLHHWFFHEIRNNWNFYDDTTKDKLEEIGWKPPHPAIKEDPSSSTGWSPIYDNYSGEDFLYMHREMIKNVNETLNQIHDPNYPKIEGWLHIPPPGDPDYPVSPPLIGIKSDESFTTRFLPWENQFTDPNYLAGVDLSMLGADIEFSIHNAMHGRWATVPAMGVRPGAQDDPLHPELISTQWDNPEYDYLGDTYSSHVNPIFWKLHGWIDDRINDWKKAHGITGEIQWKGTWVGNTHGHEHPMMMLKELSLSRKEQDDNLSNVLKIITGKGKIKGFPVIGTFAEKH